MEMGWRILGLNVQGTRLSGVPQFGDLQAPVPHVWASEGSPPWTRSMHGTQRQCPAVHSNPTAVLPIC